MILLVAHFMGMADLQSPHDVHVYPGAAFVTTNRVLKTEQLKDVRRPEFRGVKSA
jgi:hypothetical protein